MEFWRWFRLHHREVAEAYDREDQYKLEELFADRLPTPVVALNWEIGPYFAPDYTLVLSPTVRDNLPLTKQMVSTAPSIERWHFLPAKPPKGLRRLEFRLPDASALADDWRYVMLAYPDGFMELDVLIPGDVAFSESRDQLFSELVVEALLGEEVRLQHIGRINSERVAPLPCSRGIPITSLREHVRERLSHLAAET